MDEIRDKSWASQQYGLGSQCYKRRTGERAENLEQALTAFKNALKYFTREEFAKDWAGTQDWLGIVYGDRIRGVRANNLELAIEYHQNALQIYTRITFPEDWARTQQNLANAYNESLHGDPSDNLNRAIAIYQKAAEVFTRKSYPYDWVSNQSELAEALLKRASLTTDSPQTTTDFSTVITLLTEALEIAPPESMATFQQARNLYEQLQQPEKIAEVDSLYNISKRTLNNEDIKAFA